MSAAHMGMVFAAEGLDGSEKLLLLALTNYTDPHGYCWPSEERLADDCGTSRSTVQRAKRKLAARNLIRSVRRTDPRTQEPISNLTRVNLELLASMARKKVGRYDDNMLEILFGPTHENASELQRGQIDSYPEANRLPPRVTLTPPLSQSDAQSLTDPVKNPHAPSARSAPDARRAPTGSSAREAGGCAASGASGEEVHGVTLSPPGKARRQLTAAQRVLVREVLGLLPDGLRDVPELERPPRKVQDAVLEALAVGEPWERTPEQLVEFRVLPRWDRHWAALLFARGLARPVGPLVAMLKRDPLCNDPRCDEHVEVDSGQGCRVCASVRQDARAQRRTGVPTAEAEVEPTAEVLTLAAGAAVLPGQRGSSRERVPAPAWSRGIGDGDTPNEEYRRQREAMRLRRAGG